MNVYRIKVETTMISPGSTGDPGSRGRSYTNTKHWFVNEDSPESAIGAVRQKRGTQDDLFEVKEVVLMEGQCSVLDAWAERNERERRRYFNEVREAASA